MKKATIKHSLKIAAAAAASIAAALLAACGGSGAETPTGAPIGTLSGAAPTASSTAETPDAAKSYSARCLALPEGMNLLTSLRTVDGRVCFIGHFSEHSALYELTDDGVAAPIAEYAPPDSDMRAVAMCVDREALWVAETDEFNDAGAEPSYILRRLDKSGAEQSLLDVSSYVGASSADDRLEIDADGNIYLFANNYFYLFGADGELQFECKSDDAGTGGNITYMLNNIVKLPDGKVYVVAHKIDRESKKPMNAFMALDFDARELVESVSLSDNMWYFAEGIGDADFSYTNHSDSGMKNLTTGVTTRLADWDEYGLSARITAFAALPAGELLVGARRGTNMIWGGESISIISMFFGNSEAELWALSPQEETEPNEGRTTIRLACFGTFPYQAQVRLFNRDNPDYQIEVTEYDAGVDPVTFQISRDAITQFNAVVVSGSAPDIVFAPGTVSMDDYAANGLFADLFPSIDGDAELSRGTFIPAVLDAYAVNGALYRLPLSFNVITVAAPKANIGGRTSWTLDEAAELERASGKPILPNKTSREILDFMLKQNIGRFMNRDDGTCSFDSPEFIKLLEYCAWYPNDLRGAVAQTGGEQVRNGLAIAEVVALGYFFDYAAHRLEYGGDITYIGYPSEAGTGSAFQSTHTVLITAKSRNKDGAWAFLRLLFAEDFQADNVNSAFPSFPVNIAVFNSLASAATERVLSDDGAELPKMSVYVGGENIDVPALSAEEAQTVIALIASIDTVAREDYALFDIIREEAAVYFAGQRQAADAAALIQSRATIYASERG